MKKSYIWTVKIEQNEDKTFTAWFGKDNVTAAKYDNVTAEEIGKILTKNIKTVVKLNSRYGRTIIPPKKDNLFSELEKAINEYYKNDIFDKKEEFIKYLDIAISFCNDENVGLDTESVIYELQGIKEYNESNDSKFTEDIMHRIVNTIRDIISKQSYYIMPRSKLDWELMTFGTVFFTYKGKEMWVTTLVGQGSEDMLGFYHDRLQDEFKLWKKTNPGKEDLFPNLEDAMDEFYMKKEG